MRVPKKRKNYDVKNIIIWIFMIISVCKARVHFVCSFKIITLIPM
jgi:hypothetical protein